MNMVKKTSKAKFNFRQLFSKVRKTRSTVIFAGTFLAFTTIAQANPLAIASNLLHKSIDTTLYPLADKYPVTQFHYNKLKMAYLKGSDSLELREHLDENPFIDKEINEGDQISVTGQIKDCSFLSNTNNKYEAVLLRGKCINGVQILNRFSSLDDSIKVLEAQLRGLYASVIYAPFNTKSGQPKISTVKVASDLITVPTISGTSCRPVTFMLDKKACKTTLAGRVISVSVLNEEQTLVIKIAKQKKKEPFFRMWSKNIDGTFFKTW